MKRKITAITAIVLSAFIVHSAIAQIQVSEKQEIAIFSLGFYGWNIPAQTLGTIDVDIQRVFLDLGRFTIFGMEKRFSAGDVDQFIRVLRQMKEASFVLPEKYQFGEEFLTEADFNRLTGAFIIAVPVVTSFNSEFVNGKDWKTNIKTNVSFIDVARGTLVGIANVETSGTSRETEFKAVQSAIDGIPMQLQFEIRKISAFQNVTRVLAASGGRVDIQLGRDMGIQVGDEYAVIEVDEIEGLVDEREVGLILINEVGTTRSKGTVLYSRIPVAKDVGLREIPRLGADLALYGHAMNFIDHPAGTPLGFLLGARVELSRGFYNVKPYAAVQLLMDTALWLPVNAFIGGQYTMYLGRLEAGGRAGIGGGSNFILRLLEEEFSDSDDPWFSHYGISAGGYVSILINRNIKVFAEAQLDYLLGIANSLGVNAFSNYGSVQVGLGVTLKQ
jgi:hypothetical protein